MGVKTISSAMKVMGDDIMEIVGKSSLFAQPQAYYYESPLRRVSSYEKHLQSKGTVGAD
jgi:hypothetical protein